MQTLLVTTGTGWVIPVQVVATGNGTYTAVQDPPGIDERPFNMPCWQAGVTNTGGTGVASARCVMYGPYIPNMYGPYSMAAAVCATC